MSTQERIKQDAIQIAKDELDNSKPYPSWEDLIEKGALSERNKVIEEILAKIGIRDYDVDGNDVVIKNSDLRNFLKSLKV